MNMPGPCMRDTSIKVGLHFADRPGLIGILRWCAMPRGLAMEQVFSLGVRASKPLGGSPGTRGACRWDALLRLLPSMDTGNKIGFLVELDFSGEQHTSSTAGGLEAQIHELLCFGPGHHIQHSSSNMTLVHSSDIKLTAVWYTPFLQELCPSQTPGIRTVGAVPHPPSPMPFSAPQPVLPGATLPGRHDGRWSRSLAHQPVLPGAQMTALKPHAHFTAAHEAPSAEGAEGAALSHNPIAAQVHGLVCSGAGAPEGTVQSDSQVGADAQGSFGPAAARAPPAPAYLPLPQFVMRAGTGPHCAVPAGTARQPPKAPTASLPSQPTWPLPQPCRQPGSTSQPHEGSCAAVGEQDPSFCSQPCAGGTTAKAGDSTDSAVPGEPPGPLAKASAANLPPQPTQPPPHLQRQPGSSDQPLASSAPAKAVTGTVVAKAPPANLAPQPAPSPPQPQRQPGSTIQAHEGSCAGAGAQEPGSSGQPLIGGAAAKAGASTVSPVPGETPRPLAKAPPPKASPTKAPPANLPPRPTRPPPHPHRQPGSSNQPLASNAPAKAVTGTLVAKAPPPNLTPQLAPSPPQPQRQPGSNTQAHEGSCAGAGAQETGSSSQSLIVGSTAKAEETPRTPAQASNARFPPPPTRSRHKQPGSSSLPHAATQTAVGSQEPVSSSQPHAAAEVLLSPADIPSIRMLHRTGTQTAHAYLSMLRSTHTAPGEIDLSDISPSVFDWRLFLAWHPENEVIIGEGVVRFTFERFQFIKDPNLPGGRCDFVVWRVNGSQCRLHPPAKGRTISIFGNIEWWRRGKTSPPPDAEQAGALEPGHFQWPRTTAEFLRLVKPVDVLKRTALQQFLSAYGATLWKSWHLQQEITNTVIEYTVNTKTGPCLHSFVWWRWLAGRPPQEIGRIIGSGSIQKVEIIWQNDKRRWNLHFTMDDGSTSEALE